MATQEVSQLTWKSRYIWPTSNCACKADFVSQLSIKKPSNFSCKGGPRQKNGTEDPWNCMSREVSFWQPPPELRKLPNRRRNCIHEAICGILGPQQLSRETVYWCLCVHVVHAHLGPPQKKGSCKDEMTIPYNPPLHWPERAQASFASNFYIRGLPQAA